MGAFRGFATSFPGAMAASIQLGADATLAAGVATEITGLRQAFVVRDSGVYLLIPIGNLTFLLGASPPTSLVLTAQAGTVAGGTQLGTSLSLQPISAQLTANALWTEAWSGSIALNAIAGQTINCSMSGNSAAQATTVKGSSTVITWLLTRQQD